VSSKPGISIHGDGNAVGNNNRILVDKRVYNKIVQSGGGGGKPGGGGNGGSGEAAVVVGIAALVALAAAAWQFALYAPLVYFCLMVGSIGLVLVLSASALIALYKDVPLKWIAARGIALLVALLLSVAVFWSSMAYPQELSQLAARATSWNGFFCGLSTHGQSIATQHMLAMCLFATPCLVFLAGYALGSFGASLYFLRGSMWCGRLALALGSRKWLPIAAAFALFCAASQTEIANAVWQQLFQEKLHPVFTPGHAGRLSFCK
jgi:hypothetical protein